ncbi:hypothetical protein [Mesorhizobium onobrychidis]|uniref:Uncharacterized protein n=1 Tax=Mesorhizobium onobrychidis TaxID=2775404 RepID=A0ABY5QZI1_9HYPH|nr:hypothetical protein [Mesorhizobium onobrychidis]UVC16630.1 hypothetical protein IHQ72_05510 [Mesorhizobium onobrychidis]
MSEYQYYEFRAIDRPLSEADRRSLRSLSTRARITATSFTNSYEWGDFKGDPVELMERWFDLHLYLANWGTHRLIIRLPKRLVDRRRLDGFLHSVDCVDVTTSGENLIVDILCEELEPEGYWEDEADWLEALAPLRADVLGGDLRLFYLLWLMAVEAGSIEPDEAEPLPGIGPMTGALDAFARFFRLDADLVEAAAERPAGTPAEDPLSSDIIRRSLTDLPDREKTTLLARLAEGDPHVASELRALVRDRQALQTSAAQPAVAPRSAGELRARADAIREAREREQSERQEAERRRRAAEELRARRARLDAIMRRGETVWREVETEIERRNAPGYDTGAGLLLDLKAIAEERGTIGDFARRLQAIRERHIRKGSFIERLKPIG